MVGTVVRFLDGKGLNIRFRIQRTLTSTPDTGEVEIVNLEDRRREIMGSQFATLGSSTLTIRGGYEGILIGLFSGAVRMFSSGDRNGADIVTRATADDGGDVIESARLPEAVKSTTALTASNMVDIAIASFSFYESNQGREAITAHPSVAEVLSQADPSKQGPYTAAHVGTASDLLNAACRRIRCRWWIRDRQLFLGARGRPDASRPAVDITDQMLVAEPSTDGSGLKSFPVLFDPNIVPGSQVSRRGVRYRAESVVNSGETRGAPWITGVVGRAL